MPASFISERTAELILVPELINSLHPFFPKITPIYYWVSREGNTFSQRSFLNTDIKMLVLYARRPKVEHPGDETLYIKLNQLIFDRALFFRSHGIPVIAGFPLVNKLEDVMLGAKCYWLNVSGDGSENTISTNDHDLSNFLITIDDIVKMIVTSTIYTWQTALDKINEMRRSETYSGKYYHNISGDPYKPIYFLIHAQAEM